MEVMFWVWLAVMAISIIIEIITLELVSVWFAFGALIPFILSAIGGIAIEIQIPIFVVVSALLIIFARKYAQKLLFKNMNAKTNVDALVGKKCRLIEDTDFEHIGSVKINDVVWTAVSFDGSMIKAGSIVEITNVEGNKLIVKKVEGNIDLTETKIIEEKQEAVKQVANDKNEQIQKQEKDTNKKDEFTNMEE